MAHSSPELRSDYYPPRAGAGAGLRQWWLRFRRAWSGIEVRADTFSWKHVLLAVAIPGAGYYVCGRKLIGGVALAGWCCGILSFLALLPALPEQFLGFQFDPAFVAAGLAISFHTIPLSYFAQRLCHAANLATRLALGVGVTALLIFFCYYPAMTLIPRTVGLPVLWEGRMVMVNPRASPDAVKRGTTIAYQLHGLNRAGLIARSGLCIGELLALPGDQVEFTLDAVCVNGRPHPRVEHMPVSGRLQVATNCLYVWPRLHRWGAGTVSEADLMDAYGQLASVPLTNFVGKTYQRWFFWTLEP